ncbi:MAG: hypothetical protein ACI9AX_000022 [Polaromonas sp.]|jgi:hypothetical protein
MSEVRGLGDGLEQFRSAIEAKFVATLLAKTSRWVDPETFNLLPVWFPDTARKEPLYKARWSERMNNKGQPKYQGNVEANRTLTLALGTNSKDRKNWTCCHILGSAGDFSGLAKSEVNDRRYYTCTANMLLVPTPLKAFTDSVPEVIAALRIATMRLYDFVPDGQTVPDREEAGDWYPVEWEHKAGFETVKLNPFIRKRVMTRFSTMRTDFEEAPGFYPKDECRSVFNYWSAKRPLSLFKEINEDV